MKILRAMEHLDKTVPEASTADGLKSQNSPFYIPKSVCVGLSGGHSW